MCSRARGDVLEIAVGTGRNLPLYPPDVRITGIDLSASMIAIARARAIELGRDADLRVGDAQSLDLPDAAFDSVVCTLGLCSVPDPRAVAAEMRRVLRPGGRVLLLEHVRSPRPIIRTIQRALEPITVWLEGDHLLREPLEFLTAERFEIEEVERSRLGIVERAAALKSTGLEQARAGARWGADARCHSPSDPSSELASSVYNRRRVIPRSRAALVLCPPARSSAA